MHTTILLVEDELEFLKVNARLLERRGYTIFMAASVQEATQVLAQHTPDLLILDIMLPDGSGYEICKNFRVHSDNPVIFLSAKDDIQDRVEGLNQGADYYLTKPFSFDELFAIIDRLLERHQKNMQKQQAPLRAGSLELYVATATVHLNGTLLLLTKTEFAILALLMQNTNKEICSEELYKTVWNTEMHANKNVLKTHISRLRQKINCENSDVYDIRASYGRGYSFVVF